MAASQPPPQSMNAPTVYTIELHKGTKIIHALKFILPSTEPAMSTGVIAAKTNWKKIIAEPPKCSGGMPAAAAGMIA